MTFLEYRKEKLALPALTVLTCSTCTKAGCQPAVTFTVALLVQCREPVNHREAELACFAAASLDSHIFHFSCLDVLHGSVQRHFLK